MPTLTLELEEDILQKAQKLAAQRNTTLNRLVHDYVTNLVGHLERHPEDWERVQRMMRENPVEVGERTWTRESLHER